MILSSECPVARSHHALNQRQPRHIQHPHSYQPNQHQRGFTLLEMIAALALLALAMVAVSGGIGTALRTMLPSTDAIEAAELAHAKLDTICIDEVNSAGASVQEAGQNARAHWQLSVTPGARTDNLQLMNASLTVRVGERHYRFDTVCAVNAS